MEDIKQETGPSSQEDKTPKSFSKPNFKPSKKLLFIIGGAILVIALAVGAFFWLNRDHRVTQLRAAGEAYYTNFFHGQVANSMTAEKQEEFFAKSAETGLSVSADNLIRYLNFHDSAEASEKLKDTLQKCDLNQTKVVITPTEPYGNGNFTLDVKLDCKKE